VLYGGAALLVIEVCMLIYCSVDVVTTPRPDVRNLPKPLWLLLVLFFPILGGLAWLVAGRPPRSVRAARGAADPGALPEPERPSRTATAATPEDDEAFHRRLRERAEQQRRAAEQQRAQREQREDGAG
jgi:hypothetical protein